MSAPFARAKAMFALIAAAMSARMGIGHLDTYQSRGHGEGLSHNKHSRHTVAQDKRLARKRRNQCNQRKSRP